MLDTIISYIISVFMLVFAFGVVLANAAVMLAALFASLIFGGVVLIIVVSRLCIDQVQHEWKLWQARRKKEDSNG